MAEVSISNCTESPFTNDWNGRGPSIFQGMGMEKEYPSHRLIIRQGQISSGLYIVQSGRVKEELWYNGKSLILGYHTPGSLFGYDSSILKSPGSSSFLTDAKSKIQFIPKSILKSQIEFCQLVVLLEDSMEKLENRLNKIMEIVFLTARQKVASSINYFNKVYTPNGSSYMKINRSEIARISGIRRETATRIIKDFEKEGILESDGNITKIIDEKRLYRICNSLEL